MSRNRSTSGNLSHGNRYRAKIAGGFVSPSVTHSDGRAINLMAEAVDIDSAEKARAWYASGYDPDYGQVATSIIQRDGTLYVAGRLEAYLLVQQGRALMVRA